MRGRPRGRPVDVEEEAAGAALEEEAAASVRGRMVATGRIVGVEPSSAMRMASKIRALESLFFGGRPRPRFTGTTGASAGAAVAGDAAAKLVEVEAGAAAKLVAAGAVLLTSTMT